MEVINQLQERLNQVGNILSISDKKERLQALRIQSEAPNIWDDQPAATQLFSEISSLESLVKGYEEVNGWLELAEELSEEDMATLSQEVEKLERLALLSGEHDAQSAILTIHAGTGGVDAQDWAEMLQRMYLRFVEQGSTEQPDDRTLSLDRKGWEAELVEVTRGEEAGIKRAVIEVKGAYAYGLLKAEAGVHRLVRLSPFNAKNLRQTSFALVEVIPEIEQSDKVNLDEKELKIDVFRASGHGGQGVNTTDSAVRITHLPTGLSVSVQNERSQHQNKATALKILQSKLNRLQELKNSEETAILKGEFKEGSWGNQIRSYVLQPYRLVKDHRTDFETAQVEEVLNGSIGQFITSYLMKTS